MRLHHTSHRLSRFVLAVAAMSGASLLTPTTASAVITVDGHVADWGVHPGPYGDPSQWTPDSGINFFQQDHDPAVSFLGPGWGGQAFDAEAAYFTRQGGTAYFAVVTGFPLEGRPYYAAGDLAIDFGSDGSYEFGVKTTDPGHHLFGSTTWINPTPFPISGPLAIASGADWGAVQFGYDNTSYVADGHYAFEVGVPVSLFGAYWSGSDQPDFTLHWTMSCGNNAINLHVPAHTSPVPEPVSSALLLLGLGGLAVVRRRAVTSIG